MFVFFSGVQRENHTNKLKHNYLHGDMPQWEIK